MRLLILPLLAAGLFLSGCTVYGVMGEFVDGKKVPKYYVNQRGIGSIEYPNNAKSEVKPFMEIPDLTNKD